MGIIRSCKTWCIVTKFDTWINFFFDISRIKTKIWICKNPCRPPTCIIYKPVWKVWRFCYGFTLDGNDVIFNHPLYTCKELVVTDVTVYPHLSDWLWALTRFNAYYSNLDQICDCVNKLCFRNDVGSPPSSCVFHPFRNTLGRLGCLWHINLYDVFLH